MGKYSVQGAPAFDALVDAHMERITTVVYDSIYSKHWKALVLFGGYGRGDGTPQTDASGEELPFNDYGFLVVTRSITPLIKRSLKKMEASLSEELGLRVVLRPCLERCLRRSDFTLSNYEIKWGHRVIRGDENILADMPCFPADQIPTSEGTRLLMNRGKRLLEIKLRMNAGELLTQDERHLFIKYIFEMQLAFGDCALLLRGAYDISPAIRKERIREIDLSGLPDGRGMAEAYCRAIDFKARAFFQPLETANLYSWFDETARRFEEVFLWHERRRLNRAFRTLEKYAHGFPDLGKEGSARKNALQSMRAFGLGALSSPFTHPRLRLYAALPLLLTPHANQDEIRWLLCSQQSSFEGLCEVFESLHQQFS